MSAVTSMPLEIMVALAAVFLTVALVAGVVTVAAMPRRAQRRLESLARAADSSGGVLSPSVKAVGLDPALARWSRLLPKSAKDMSVLERRLASAGNHSNTALVAMAIAPLLLSAGLGIGVLTWYGVMNRSGWIFAILAAVAGYLAPGFYLDSRISQRRKEIRHALPDVLDLLIVCLEAGSSLDQSIVKVTEELAIAYPALSEELRIVTTETRAGKPRLEALKNLAQRTKVDDVRTLVAMLTQTDRFGTSVAQALRTMADDMRTRRRQAAEEMAAKIGVKLVFPLVFFMFPALFVVVLGPAYVQFVRVFSQVGR